MCEAGINERYHGGVDSPVDGWNRERTNFLRAVSWTGRVCGLIDDLSIDAGLP